MCMDANKPAHIHLFGDPEENFYALGAKDKDSFQDVYQQITRLCARADFLAKALKLSAEMAGNLKSKGQIDLNKELKAYAEGLERPLSEVQFLFLLPEVVASFNKWLPNLMSIIPGCSSLFMKSNSGKGVIHGRVLDYAIGGPFERNERSALYDFKGRMKVFTHTSAGMPLPSITSINERGLTIALHYKHGNYLDLKGDSIFSIAYQIISYCSDIHEVIKFLKNYPSMSHWGLYLSDRNGEVASIDIRGREIYQEKFDLKEYPYLYFNNRPLLKDPVFKQTQPYGSLQQCKMRRDSIAKRLKSFNSKEASPIEALKLLSTPGSKKGDNSKLWKMDTITPSSIQVVAFDSGDMSSHSILGAAPKILKNDILRQDNLFGEVKFSDVKIKHKFDENFVTAYEKLASFQSSLDAGDTEKAYHQLQMAKELFQDYPESNIAKFYFTVLEYLYESDKKEISYLLEELEGYEGMLPDYLEDHRKLFVMRVEKLLGHSPSFAAKDIKNSNLAQLFGKEIKLRKEAIKILKKFTFPRIEILDILYAY